ncbi:MAG TPA: cytochrome b N-terminal domain-containing protein, partial [Thermoanaerobaculia bacterium]|nr:cytochrome b N-terminal domain-containing protein [Thermoanaerobaculia bacterium]
MSSTRQWPSEVRRRASAWLGQFWSDVKASVDPGLLAGARFLGLLYGRIDRRLPIDQALRASLQRRLPAHAGWRHALGGISHLLFLVLVVTGVLLCVYYRPSAEEAYASIQFLVSEVRLGWLVRDLHVWSANLIVIAVLAHMARVWIDGAYKPPRETSWFVGLVLLFVVLAFGATGYLLPWDQSAYWTVAEALGVLERAPVLGKPVADLLRGDESVSGATVSRFFVIHAIVLPWVAFALLSFHFSVVRKHGPAPRLGAPKAEGEGVPFFPDHLLRSFIVSVLVLATALTMAIWFPRPVGSPATPFQVPESLLSTWVVVDVARALLRYLGPWGLALFTIVGLALALVPLFDRQPERSLRQRPATAVLGILFFVGFVVAWLVGRNLEGPGAPPPPASEPAPAAEAPVPTAAAAESTAPEAG